MSSINPLQQQALAQMLTYGGTPAPAQAAGAMPASSAAGGLASGIQPLIQALAARRMQDMLARAGQPQQPGQVPQPPAQPQMQQVPNDPYAQVG